jgi:site-specific DNA recombinase
MFVKILGTFAEYERENLAERVSLGYEQKTREGNYTNTNGVYGYNYIIGKGLEVNVEEKKIVIDIYESYLKGDSMLSICKDLNKLQVPTKRGGKWAQSTLKSILTNPLYLGKVRYGLTKKNKHRSFIAEGKEVESILDEKLFNDVQKMMTKRQQFHTKKYSSDYSYYFHVLRCSKCGSKYHARQQIQNGKKYITYACNGHYNGTCSAPGFSHFKMEQVFLEYLDRVELFEEDISVLKMVKQSDIKDSNEQIKKELNKVRSKKNETRNFFLEGSLPFDEYSLLINKLNEKELLLNASYLQINEPIKEEISFTDINQIITNLKLNWIYLTDKERKNFLERFIKRIEVKKEDGEVLITKLDF